jgi:hypothetical protein
VQQRFTAARRSDSSSVRPPVLRRRALSGLCGEYSVLWEPPNDERQLQATLTAVVGQRVGLDLEGKQQEQLKAEWCGNIAGDEHYELATQRYTRGAHCCSIFRVDTLGGRKLLEVDLGNVDELEPAQLDDDEAEEIVSRSDVLAYFGDLPGAAMSGSMLPLVFDFRKGRYVEATTDYPEHIRASARKARKDLDAALDRRDVSDGIKSLALGMFGHYVLLGEEDIGFDAAAKGVPDDVSDWLREHRADAVKQIRKSSRP